MDLHQKRLASVFEALDQGRLPQRPRAVQAVGELAPDEPAELGIACRVGQARLTDVPVEIERRVVRPDRIREAERRLLEPLAQPGDEVDPLRDPPRDHRAGQWRLGVEDQQPAHCHVDGALLRRQGRPIRRG